MSDAQVTAPASTETQSTEAAPVPVPGKEGGAQTGDVAAAAAEAVRRLKYKNRQGIEEEVDESEALKVYAQRKEHQSVASKLMNEAKAERARVEQVLKMIEDDDQLEEGLRKIGKDPRKLAEKILSKYLEDELMDPKDKELRDKSRRLDEYEKREKQEKEAIEKRAHDLKVERLRTKFEKDFIEVLETSKLPKTKQMVSRMAAYVERGARLRDPITPAEAAKLVEQDLKQEHGSIGGEADVESLINLYGEDFINKVRKYDTSRLKDPAALLRTPTDQPTERRERGVASKQRMSPREWRLHKMGLK